MDFYLVSLVLGFAGMAVMAVGGLGHGHGHGGHGHGHGGDGAHFGHGGHGGHIGAGHGHSDVNLHGAGGHAMPVAAAHGHAGPAAHGGHGHGPAHEGAHGAADAGRGLVLAGLGNLVSPRVISSVAFGMGATGVLAHPYLGGPLLFGAALAGGVGLESLVMRPLWGGMMRFVSRPAQMLDATIMDTAQAVTTFNPRGEGLISLELDGQVRQLLGVLTPGEVQAGVRVKSGDRVLIENVDAERNRCTVSYLGS
ncbi:MAG TPA: hypothetical protein VFH27_08370 [Longimicrobiaceae bacterium]|nr:hypothetical protein [Longimicrobiaceae bacterium]